MKCILQKGVTTELSSLVNLIQAVHFHSFDDSMQSGKCYHMSSFAEAKALRLIEIHAAQFVDYNKRQLSRIYPAGSRTSSSNFDPVDFWNVGCQIGKCVQPVITKWLYFKSNEFYLKVGMSYSCLLITLFRLPH